MADIRYSKNEDGSAVAVRVGGAGANVALGVGAHRIKVSGEIGKAGQWPIGQGTFYGAAGVVVSGGINNSNLATERASTAMPTYADKISAPQAVEFLDGLEKATKGSYNVNDLTLGAAFDLGKRYPAVLSPARQVTLGRIDGYIDQGIDTVEKARADLLQRLSGNDIPAAIRSTAEFKKLQTELSRPITRGAVDAVTIGQIGNVANSLSAYLRARGGAEGITNHLDAEVNGVAAQLSGFLDRAQVAVTKFGAQASNVERQIAELRGDVSGFSSIHAQVARVNQQLAGARISTEAIALSDERRNRLTETFSEVEGEVEKVAARRNSPPDPEDLREDHALARKLMRYDPAAEASGYVASAYESRVPVVGTLTLGGMVQRGLRVDVDNLWAVRGGDNTLRKEIIPSSVHSSVVFVGAGSNAGVATPEDVRSRLGIAPGDVGLNVGGYVALRRQRETLMRVTLEDKTTAEIVGKMTQGLGNGRYQYAEAGVSAPIKPQDGAKPSAIVRLGRTF